MNLDLIFKALLAAEILGIVLLIIFAWRRLLRDWHTTLAGLVVITISLGLQALYFANAHQLHDLTGLVQFLAVGIAFLLAGDGRQDA